MSPSSTVHNLPALGDSPLFLLAALVAARRSRDRVLERLVRRRLDQLGVRVWFGDQVPAPDHGREGNR